jgi:hypothetical protein
MPTAFETEVLSHFPEVCFFMEDSGLPMTNAGTHGIVFSAANDTPDYQESGPAATPFSVGFDVSVGGGTNEPALWNATNADWFHSTTTGTILLAFKSNGDEDGGMMFSTGELPQSNAKHFWISLNPDGSVFFRVAANNSDQAQYSTTLAGLDDDAWHLAIFRQKADGTGVEAFIDERVDVQGTYQELGASSKDWWYDGVSLTAANLDRTALGYNIGAVDRYFDGWIAAYAEVGSALSDANIDAIFALWGSNGSGVITFSNKTIRRVGRRVFSANI